MEDINGQQLFSKLPIDIFCDIISRLQLKTISQCRYVCKSWYDLIHSPRFAQIHYNRVKKSPCVFLRDWNKDCYLIDHQVLDTFESCATAYDVKLCDKVFGEKGGGFVCYDVVGSVNGLICFYPDLGLYCICNPVTGEYVVVPGSDKSDVRPVVSGFGFDPVNDDYKVIRILEKSEKDFEAEVFSLGLDSWRRIEHVPKITNKSAAHVFINGRLHWITCEKNGSKVIVSFDVRTDEFDVMQLPVYPNKDKNDTFESLGVLGECLCFIDDDFFKDLEVWVMKDYGEEKSWTREYVLERKYVYRFWHGVYEMIQLRNGKLLMLNDKQSLGYYDTLKKSFRPIVIKKLNQESSVKIRQPIIQVGSLFSPKYAGHH